VSKKLIQLCMVENRGNLKENIYLCQTTPGKLPIFFFRKNRLCTVVSDVLYNGASQKWQLVRKCSSWRDNPREIIEFPVSKIRHSLSKNFAHHRENIRAYIQVSRYEDFDFKQLNFA
jgi:hypothetical protein